MIENQAWGANNYSVDRMWYKFHVDDEIAFFTLPYVSPYEPVELPLLNQFEAITDGRISTIKDWLANNWHISIYFAAAYVFLVFLGKKHMQNKRKFDLQFPLCIWSGILAVFSIIASIRLIGELLYFLYNYGFYYTVCYPTTYYGRSAIWALLFILSKVYELGDTGFIVLRKQPLILLHWYHHATVLIYSWYTYQMHAAPGRWFCTLNYVVHAFMYTYYTLKAAKIRIPSFVNMAITSLQISQMVVGTVVCTYGYYTLSSGQFCHTTTNHVFWGLAMYISYFVLFGEYFYKTYMCKRKPAAVSNGVVKEIKNGVEHPVIAHINSHVYHDKEL